MIECPGMKQLGHRNAVLVDVIVGQCRLFAVHAGRSAVGLDFPRQRDQAGRAELRVV